MQYNKNLTIHKRRIFKEWWVNWYACMVPWLPGVSVKSEKKKRNFSVYSYVNLLTQRNFKYALDGWMWVVCVLEHYRELLKLNPTTPKTTMTLQDLFVLLSFCFHRALTHFSYWLNNYKMTYLKGFGRMVITFHQRMIKIWNKKHMKAKEWR